MEQQKQELRAYFFQNFYLQGIHAGIQAQHTMAEMFVKYIMGSEKEMLLDWAQNHKTTIVLNGGMSGDLQAIVDLLSSPQNTYPWAFFKETEYALNGALTNVGIILPERIYNHDKNFSELLSGRNIGNMALDVHYEPPKLSDFDSKIVEALRGKRLMS